jgi:hypothetical protein
MQVVFSPAPNSGGEIMIAMEGMKSPVPNGGREITACN